MVQKLPLRSLAFATVCAIGAISGAQTYYSSDDFFCSPHYHAATLQAYSGGGGSGKVSMSDFSFMSSSNKRSSLSRTLGLVETHQFDFDCSLSWSFGASQSSPPSSGTGSGRCVMTTEYQGTDSSGADLFACDLVSMQASVSDLDGDGILLRESPTKSSTGRFDIEQTLPATSVPGIKGLQPLASNGFKILSFFDVFTDVSLDGGKTFSSSEGATHLQGTPEPASMAAMGVGIAALLRRRRKARTA